MKSLAALALLVSVSASASLTDTGRTILVLDASGSMWGQINGRAKIEIAREVVGQLVDSLPAETEIGLVGRTAIRIDAAEAYLKAADSAVAGAKVAVEWTGPNNAGDYLTIVPKSFEGGKYGRYAYTRDGSPCEVEAPDTAGACEIRYTSGQGGAVLGRIRIEVVEKE